MNKILYGLFGSVIVFALLVIGVAGTAQAEVNVNISIGQPREMVMMPTGIYFVQDSNVDVFFYNGYWWYPRGGSWYRAGQYNGPWVVVQRNYVPAYLFRVPKNYRAVYKNERRINYGQWKINYGQSKKQDRQGKMQGRNKEGRGGKH